MIVTIAATAATIMPVIRGSKNSGNIAVKYSFLRPAHLEDQPSDSLDLDALAGPKRGITDRVPDLGLDGDLACVLMPFKDPAGFSDHTFGAGEGFLFLMEYLSDNREDKMFE